MEEAARKELHLYNSYFVDVLFRSTLPRQRVHTPLCHDHVPTTLTQLQDMTGQPCMQRANRPDLFSRACRGHLYAVQFAP